jgi:23S rRNA (cytosine1962-C5)-methyltransferase
MSGKTILKLKPGARKARVRRGHPWVFAGEVESLPDAASDGQALPLEDERGRFLGTGLVNTQSQILWRRISREAIDWGPSFWRQALEKAIAKREEEPFRRLVWSEADGLPGLVVDQYGDVLVVQALTLGMDRVLEPLIELLLEILGQFEVVIRNDAPTRQLEGLGLSKRTHSGKPVQPFWGHIYTLDYWLDLEHSQKTGFYLDQRQEHFKVATLSPDWRVLDCFCNQGAFALNCAQAGAREVVGIDTSGESLALARKNAEHNGLEADFIEANVFDWFHGYKGERFDLIVLDPPSFAPNKRAVEGALRGYKELHVRALKLLNPGGILATYCCSHHITRSLFRDVVDAAAADIRRNGQVLYETSQPHDHPVVLNFPESEYLKGLLLRVDGD